MPPKKVFIKKTTAAISANPYSTYLVIVESPSKCKKIEEYLGDKYQCIASKGHIRHIDGLKKIDTKHKYDIEFSIIEEKKDHITAMKSTIEKYKKENIYLATDDDREGEAISWHICQVFDLPVESTKRILFHEITKPAIVAAISKPTTINMSLVYAQHARQVLDLLVGFKISPVLWKHIHCNKKNGLSAGRCQTPALRLVYENDKQIKSAADSVAIKSKITGYFYAKNIAFDLDQVFDSDESVVEFLELSKTFNHILSINNAKPGKSSPPAPLTTSKLLQVSNNILHYSPKLTMELCQSLYQSGLITYMRTDSSKYSPVFLESAKNYIMQKFESAEYVGDHEAIMNKDSNAPHEAIRVTNLSLDTFTTENPLLLKMYRLIWKNTLESCMSVYKYTTTHVYLSAPNKYRYEHSIETPLFLGWKRVHVNVGEDTTTAIQNESAGLLFYLKSLAKNSVAPYNYIESKTSMTSRFSHYSEASLIQKLEDVGIGRPSTYATIVDTIVERGYVNKKDVEGYRFLCREYKMRGQTIDVVESEKVFGAEKNKLVIQPTGIVAVEFLLSHFESMFQYNYTKTMEDELDKIAVSTEASDSWWRLCDEGNRLLKDLVKLTSKLDKQTYKIDETYELVFHQWGASLKYTNESGEAAYKSVKHGLTIDMDKLKRGEYTATELMERDGYLGDYDGEPVILKNGKYGIYIEHGDKKKSVKAIAKSFDQIELSDIVSYLKETSREAGQSTYIDSLADNYQTASIKMSAPEPDQLLNNKSVLRVLNDNLSIRKGKFGAYIYYKTPQMKTPQFFNLKKFNEGFGTCDKQVLLDWIKTNYQVS